MFTSLRVCLSCHHSRVPYMTVRCDLCDSRHAICSTCWHRWLQEINDASNLPGALSEVIYEAIGKFHACYPPPPPQTQEEEQAAASMLLRLSRKGPPTCKRGGCYKPCERHRHARDPDSEWWTRLCRRHLDEVAARMAQKRRLKRETILREHRLSQEESNQ